LGSPARLLTGRDESENSPIATTAAIRVKEKLGFIERSCNFLEKAFLEKGLWQMKSASITTGWGR
jgi:hypothetical protein